MLGEGLLWLHLDMKRRRGGGVAVVVVLGCRATVGLWPRSDVKRRG